MKPALFYLIFFGILSGLLGCKKDHVENVPPGQDWTYDPTPFEIKAPASFPILNIPVGNPTTVEGVKLGRMLYYDPVLHSDSLRACASCHSQERSFTSDPPVLPHVNLAWNTSFLWNGKVEGALEDIMLFEVKEFFKTDLEKLQNHQDYPKLFYEAFGARTITHELCAKALSQFQRTLISGKSKYDRVLEGTNWVFLTDEELNGFDIFFTEKGDCFHCHGGILFTDNSFHNNALDASPEPARSAITSNPADVGKFKSPTLRNIELTGPYMHDGRYETLEEVVDFYSEGLKTSETVDPLMKSLHLGGKHLTTQEKSDLIAFLKSLTDTAFIADTALASPFH